jgi:L-aminopeptidase/D-esterase-like protein
MLGPKFAMKGGLGSASRQIEGGVIVAAIVAVNAVGDVIDPRSGQIVAGARHPSRKGFANSAEPSINVAGTLPQMAAGTNTTIGVVATNAALSKSGANKVAQMAHDGLARSIRPVHTPFDGDTIFALSLGEAKADVGRVGAVAADVLADAVVNAVLAAESLAGMPAVRDLK